MALDRDSVKRVLDHYKHSLEDFLEDENVKHHGDPNFAKHLTDLKRNVDRALTEFSPLKTDAETRKWAQRHASVLKSAGVRYEKDMKRFLKEAEARLSESNRKELEIEVTRLVAEIATLLNL